MSEGLLLPEGAPTVAGTDSLQGWARRFFDTYESRIAVEPIEIEVAGDFAFARDRISGTLTPKAGGAPVDLQAKELAIFRRQADGSWKVARLIYNSDQQH
jgi:ketosteroid isomerase-like protein